MKSWPLMIWTTCIVRGWRTTVVYLSTSDQTLLNSGLTRKMVVLKVRLGSTAALLISINCTTIHHLPKNLSIDRWRKYILLVLLRLLSGKQ